MEQDRVGIDVSSFDITNISVAKVALSDCLGLQISEFCRLLRHADVPATLVKNFGKGALLLIPASMMKYRCLPTMLP